MEEHKLLRRASYEKGRKEEAYGGTMPTWVIPNSIARNVVTCDKRMVTQGGQGIGNSETLKGPALSILFKSENTKSSSGRG